MTSEERKALHTRVVARKSYWGIPEKEPLHPQSKKEWLNSYKQEHGCLLCGETDPVVLDFHHVNSKDKQHDISSLAGDKNGGWHALETEIAKCVVLCSNCHRRVHRGILTEEEQQSLLTRQSSAIAISRVASASVKPKKIAEPRRKARPKRSPYWAECLNHPIHWDDGQETREELSCELSTAPSASLIKSRLAASACANLALRTTTSEEISGRADFSETR